MKLNNFDKLESLEPLQKLEVADFTYGIGNDKLDANIAIKNLPTGGKFYPYVIQQSISATTTITITPGFPIKYVEIRGYDNGTDVRMSESIYTKSTGYAIGISQKNGSVQDFNSNTQVFKIDATSTNDNIRARIENITSTSFNINFYEVEFSGYITMFVKCYG